MPTIDALKTEIASVTKAWADGFNRRDAASLSALYDADATLWGTLSSDIISTPNGVRAYFEKACSSPLASKVTFDEQLIRACADAMLDSGSYTFTFLKDGKEQSFPARFSMVFRKKGNRWMIVDHHSSAKPAAPQSQ